MTTLDLLDIAPQLAAYGFRSGLLTQKPSQLPAQKPEYLEAASERVTWRWIGQRLGITASAAHMNWRGNRNSHRAAVAELIQRHGEPGRRNRK